MWRTHSITDVLFAANDTCICADNENTQQYYRTQTSQDESNTGLNILSFLFPWAGWVLYFVYKSESPKKAKGCLKWAWIGVACGIILTILFVCLLIYSEDFAEGFVEGYMESYY